MPSLIGTSVAANYRTQQVPYSRFGSRKVVWFNIGQIRFSAQSDSSDIVMSTLNTVIDTIQTRAEIAIIGAPHVGHNHGRITVGVFEDTFNDGNNLALEESNPGNGYNAKATTLQDALREALAGVDGDEISVQEVYLFGGLASENNDPTGDYGWTTDAAYQEYYTKFEYVENSPINPDPNLKAFYNS
jgi:hypothetical protein